MFHTNCISVTSIILQMKSISPPALPILITAGFPIWSINGVGHPEPDLKLENSGYNTTSNPTVITFMQTRGPLNTIWVEDGDLCALFFWWVFFFGGGGDVGIDLQDCFVQFSAGEKWTCGIQMPECDEHNIPALDGSSSSLPSVSFRDKATIADHCVPSAFKWQTSSVVTVFTQCFIEETLKIEGGNQFTHADG